MFHKHTWVFLSCNIGTSSGILKKLLAFGARGLWFKSGSLHSNFRDWVFLASK